MNLSSPAGGERGPLDLVLRRRPLLALMAMWLLGLSSVGAVLLLQHRLEQRRHALVVVADLRKEAGDLSPMAFQTTLGVPRAAVRARLTLAEAQLTASATSLTGLSGNDSDSKLIMARARPVFALLTGANELAGSGNLRQAAFLLLAAVQPGGSIASLRSAFDRTALKYDREAARSKHLSDLGTVFAIVLALLAFSLALRRATRLAAEKHRLLEKSLDDALTDSLTGLSNRRKLFSDMSVLLAEHQPGEVLALGMLDLDGFKAYNDTFGHPAGDALLARVGQKLNAAVAGVGRAYRIGGDEFCVIARGDGAEAVLESAQEALSERNEGFTVRCGLGSVVIAPDEVTLEDALRTADQRLYLNKAAARSDENAHARDVLMRVIADKSTTLAAHSSNVGRLAVAVAEQLGLSDDEVTLTRLTAELHDIGKTAIPDEILGKPGRLDDSEWLFVKQHTVIGERILSAAPALARIAPLVRATHERPDGTGYPDGLCLDEIPLSSRIVAVVDAYDAMTSTRSYSAVLSPEQAAAELSRCAGTQFDAAVVAAFVEVLGKLAGEKAQRPAPSLDARVGVAA